MIYWYYVFQFFDANGVLTIKNGVVKRTNLPHFQLFNVQTDMMEKFKTNTVCITFWGEISESSYVQFLEQAKKT